MIKPKKNIEQLKRMKDFGSDRSSFMRLDKNERTIPFPDKIFKSMLATISNDNLTMYPDQTPLYKQLSELLLIDNDYLLLTPGSDAAIKSIFETYVSAGDKVVYLWPTYAMIDVYAEMFQAEKIKIEYSSKLELDYDLLIRNIDDKTKAVFIANPNQPTGTVISEEQTKVLVKKTKDTNTLLVFDEAYQPFSGNDSNIKYVKKNAHVIVVQTLSKAVGLASVRLGYIVSQPTNIQWLYKVKSYADINLPAIKIGEYLLKNYSVVEDYIKSVNESKLLLETELNALGVSVIKGYANFVHMKLPPNNDLEFIAEQMKTKGYLIRTTGSGLPAVLEGCIRVTVGPVLQMKSFIKDLSTLLEKN